MCWQVPWHRFLQRDAFTSSTLLVAISIVILDFLADIEYYGVYEPNIIDAMLLLTIFKPLEYVAEGIVDRLITNDKRDSQSY